MNMFKNISKVTIFALPISLSGLINMVASFIAMLFVARVGKIELAAGALSVSTYITIMTVFVFVLYSVGILASHYRGQQKNHEEIGRLIKTGFWVAIFMSIPAIILLWNVDKILILFRQDPKLINAAVGYFHYAALSMVPTLIGAVIAQFYTGIGKPRFSMIISTISLPFTIFFSYALILGKFGFPKLALAGVTAAIFIVQLILYISLLFYMYFSKSIKKYKIFSCGFWPNWSLCKNIFSLGIPVGIQFGSEIAAMTVATYFMGYFGVTALAAIQIVGQYSLIVVMITLGISQAVSILVSEALGNHDIYLMKQYLLSAIIILVSFFVLVFVVFLLIPKSLISIFIDINNPSNHQLVSLAIDLFIISAVLLLVDGVRNLLSGGLRGLHDSKAPMKIGVSCLWLISLPICYLVAFPLKGGPLGLRISFISGFLVAVILLWQRFNLKLATSAKIATNTQ
jgi:putative MATE family efflux protein